MAVWLLDGNEWKEPREQTSTNLLQDYAIIAPIFDSSLNVTDSVVAVGVGDQKLYSLESLVKDVVDPSKLWVTEKPILHPTQLDVGEIDTGTIPVGGTQPAAIQGTSLQVVAVSAAKDNLVAVDVGSSAEQLGLLIAAS